MHQDTVLNEREDGREGWEGMGGNMLLAIF